MRLYLRQKIIKKRIMFSKIHFLFQIDSNIKTNPNFSLCIFKLLCTLSYFKDLHFSGISNKRFKR